MLYDSTSKEKPGTFVNGSWKLILICQVSKTMLKLPATSGYLLHLVTRKRSFVQFCSDSTWPNWCICTHSVAAIQLLQQIIQSLAVVCYENT